MKKYYPGIQMFRAVLFLLVLAFHCGVPFFDFGWVGVEAFFVISAFFLVRKYWGSDEIDIKEQFKHRITRLYPPYIAVLFVSVLYALIIKTIPYDLVVHLISAQNFQWMITGYKSILQPVTAHTWTLSIEVWRGLIWLLILRWSSKDSFKKVMYVCLVLGIIYRVVTISFDAGVWVVSLCPLAHFDAFACGSLLAIGINEKKVNKKIGAVGLVGLIGIVSCVIFLSQTSDISFLDAYRQLSSSKNYLGNCFSGNIYLFISLFTVGIVGLLCIHDEKRIKELGKVGKAFSWFGDKTYILYLFHWPILVILKKLIHNWGVLFLTTLIISIVSEEFFNWLYTNIQKKCRRRVVS